MTDSKIMKKYEKDLNKLDKITEDGEAFHLDLDDLLTTFVEDIANKKIPNIAEARVIANKIIDKLDQHKDVKIWYA